MRFFFLFSPFPGKTSRNKEFLNCRSPIGKPLFISLSASLWTSAKLILNLQVKKQKYKCEYIIKLIGNKLFPIGRLLLGFELSSEDWSLDLLTVLVSFWYYWTSFCEFFIIKILCHMMSFEIFKERNIQTVPCHILWRVNFSHTCIMTRGRPILSIHGYDVVAPSKIAEKEWLWNYETLRFWLSTAFW